MIDHDYQAEECERATAGEWDSDWDSDGDGAAFYGALAVIGLILAGAFVFLRIKGVM